MFGEPPCDWKKGERKHITLPQSTQLLPRTSPPLFTKNPTFAHLKRHFFFVHPKRTGSASATLNWWYASAVAAATATGVMHIIDFTHWGWHKPFVVQAGCLFFFESFLKEDKIYIYLLQLFNFPKKKHLPLLVWFSLSSLHLQSTLRTPEAPPVELGSFAKREATVEAFAKGV